MNNPHLSTPCAGINYLLNSVMCKRGKGIWSGEIMRVSRFSDEVGFWYESTTPLKNWTDSHVWHVVRIARVMPRGRDLWTSADEILRGLADSVGELAAMSCNSHLLCLDAWGMLMPMSSAWDEKKERNSASVPHLGSNNSDRLVLLRLATRPLSISDSLAAGDWEILFIIRPYR